MATGDIPGRPSTPQENLAFAKAGAPPQSEDRFASRALDWEALEERGLPPARAWALDSWLGMGHVTLLAGMGGVGKSLLAQQMGTALALGREFIVKPTEARTVLYWAGEDDHDELWRRQMAISAHFQSPLSALRGRFHIEPMADRQCSLFEEFHGETMRTSAMNDLDEQIKDLHADVVILDNIARLFGGRENDRHQVTSFIAELTAATVSTGAAVLLLGHVSKAQNSEFSGSTAWENACRARLYFGDQPPDAKEPKDGDDEEPPTDLRFLARRKANYSARDICTLRYEKGAYDVIVAPSGGGVIASIRTERAKRIVIDSLGRLLIMGLDPNDSTASPNYLPKLIAAHSLAEGFTKQELGQAMRHLMTDGKLRRQVTGQYANRTPKHGLRMV